MTITNEIPYFCAKEILYFLLFGGGKALLAPCYHKKCLYFFFNSKSKNETISVKLI